MDANTPGMLPSVAAKGADESSASDRAGQIRQRNVLTETYIRTAERDIDHDYMSKRYARGQDVGDDPKELARRQLHFPSNDN